jgi:hypothetical protein
MKENLASKGVCWWVIVFRCNAILALSGIFYAGRDFRRGALGAGYSPQPQHGRRIHHQHHRVRAQFCLDCLDLSLKQEVRRRRNGT